MNAPDNVPSVTRHSLLEDVLAIVTGTLFVSLGITLFKQGVCCLAARPAWPF